ncbi:hypothetical protein J5X84_21995 [Streptosporangiaceae bacterium NEAU-GS5]|nr:hypothetical protein [Streptosporangiaceae bacterium NEAU-GS5]
MMGLELLAGYAVAYLVRKARRVAGRADAEVDRTLDAGMDRLHELIGGKLGQDRALAKLEQEAGAGEVSARTIERVELAIADEAESDQGFAARLEELVTALQAADPTAGVTASDHSVAAGRDVNVHAEGHGVAGGVIHGGVSTGNPPPPGPASA